MSIIPPNDATKRRVPCRTQNCGGVLEHLDISTAIALAAHQGLTGAPETHALCNRCGRRSHYAYDELLEFLPATKRPRDLPQGFVFALAVARLPGPEGTKGEMFLGERLLVKFTEVDGGEWLACGSCSSW